ncbi:MAG: tetratricopeptide repeat protein [Gemmatimonadetes bacterium]|nr:tetratricopeptide repeat protein [Gemmatimonadota bacterium]
MSGTDGAPPSESWSEPFGRAVSLARDARQSEQEGRLTDALESYRAALRIISGAPPTPMTANLLRWIGSVHRDMGRTSEAERFYEESLRTAREAGTAAGQAAALNCSAAMAQRRGDLDAAEDLYGRAGRLAAEAGEIRLAGMIEQNLGVLANIRGDLDAALARYRASLRAFDQIRDDEARSWVLNNMGMLLNDLRQHSRAEQAFEQGLAIARGRGDGAMEAALLTNLAEGLIAEGRHEEAGRALVRARQIVDSGDDLLRKAEVRKFQGVLARERRGYEEADLLLGEALDMAREAEDVLVLSEIQREIGSLRLLRGRPDEARTAWQEALAGFQSIDATLDRQLVEQALAQTGVEARPT